MSVRRLSKLLATITKVVAPMVKVSMSAAPRVMKESISTKSPPVKWNTCIRACQIAITCYGAIAIKDDSAIPDY